MKNLLLAVVCLVVFGNCGNADKPADLPPGVKAVVADDVIQVDSYTYIHGKSGEAAIWLAGPTIDAQKGKTYYYRGGMEMKDFHSKALDRTFESIYFVSLLSDSPQLKMPTAPAALNPAAPAADASAANANAETVEGVLTIEQVYNRRAELSGKRVTVRGEVTKVNNQIMGRNWIHVQDGSGQAGTNDLLITSAQTAAKGDKISAQGIVTVDKNFGAGYVFKVLLSDATVTAEK